MDGIVLFNIYLNQLPSHENPSRARFGPRYDVRDTTHLESVAPKRRPFLRGNFVTDQIQINADPRRHIKDCFIYSPLNTSIDLQRGVGNNLVADLVSSSRPRHDSRTGIPVRVLLGARLC
jgi:hypothetical protein